MAKVYSTQKEEKEKCIVIVVCCSKNDDKNRKLDEIVRLAESTDLEVVGSFSQNIKEFTKATVLGSGKLDEIRKYIDESNATIDVAIVDYALTGSQAKNISEILGVKVIDRVGLIIDIFAKRAQSSEAKLQVKYAQDRYLIPRLNEVRSAGGRFGGSGVGMRGPGETKLELDRRRIDKEMDLLRKEIKKVKEQRNVNRRNRDKNNIKKIAIVGYTNAGKSTLLNTLTKDNIYVEDKYFATLDTTSRKLYLGEGKYAIITDTVGFITDLPHELVEAFSSTLEEARDADLILHVVDSNQKGKDGSMYFKENIRVTNKVLDDIGANGERILVYNKCDMLPSSDREDGVVYVSAKTGKGIDKLKEIISNKLFN